MTEMRTNTLPPEDGREYVFNGTNWELSEEEQRKEKWYTIKEAAKETKFSENAIWLAIKSGKMVASMISDSSARGFKYMIRESDLISWLDNPDFHRHGSAKGKRKPRKVKAEPKPTLVIDTVEKAGYDDDILAIAEHLMKVLEKHKIAAYDTGYADGKLSVQHDDEDAYRRGFEEGKEQAKAELMAIIKEVG